MDGIIVSGSGYFIPHMLVYPRSRISSEFGKICPVPVIYSCSKSGLINELFFLGFSILKIVSNYLKTIHESRISHRVCNYCKCVGIIVGYFLPRNSHRLQPLCINTFTAIVELSRFNNSCLKSPASTLVDLTFQSRALRYFSLNQLRNLPL